MTVPSEHNPKPPADDVSHLSLPTKKLLTNVDLLNRQLRSNGGQPKLHRTFSSQDENAYHQIQRKDNFGFARPALGFVILSGSLNPIHAMHLTLMEVARKVVQAVEAIDVVAGFVVPCPDSCLREKLICGHLSLTDRVLVAKLATQHSDWIDVVDWGLHDSFHICQVITSLLQKDFPSFDIVGYEVVGSDFAVRDKLWDTGQDEKKAACRNLVCLGRLTDTFVVKTHIQSSSMIVPLKYDSICPFDNGEERKSLGGATTRNSYSKMADGDMRRNIPKRWMPELGPSDDPPKLTDNGASFSQKQCSANVFSGKEVPASRISADYCSSNILRLSQSLLDMPANVPHCPGSFVNVFVMPFSQKSHPISGRAEGNVSHNTREGSSAVPWISTRAISAYSKANAVLLPTCFPYRGTFILVDANLGDPLSSSAVRELIDAYAGQPEENAGFYKRRLSITKCPQNQQKTDTLHDWCQSGQDSQVKRAYDELVRRGWLAASVATALRQWNWIPLAVRSRL